MGERGRKVGMGSDCAGRLVTCSGSGGSSKQCKNAQRDSTHASKYGAPGTGVRSNSPISRPNISGPNPSVRACASQSKERVTDIIWSEQIEQ